MIFPPGSGEKIIRLSQEERILEPKQKKATFHYIIYRYTNINSSLIYCLSDVDMHIFYAYFFNINLSMIFKNMHPFLVLTLIHQ